MKKCFLYIAIILISKIAVAQEIPYDSVISNTQLFDYLKKDAKTNLSNSQDVMASYFRKTFSDRFFYDYHQFDARFDLYTELYNQKKLHLVGAKKFMDKYESNTPWKLPMNFKNGEPVTAYEFRHLARQHKMVDVGFSYFYENKNRMYMDYFTSHIHSLNQALETDKYENLKDGNGVYESFRSGYRVLNWLWIHNIFLNEKAYTDDQQLTTIATLLQHGANLYKNNKKFSPGNHQTRGVSALAMISILLRDFEGTDAWYNLAMERLNEHMEKEINPDGFQSERSVHYHISDIENYFYVYQLAHKSNIKLDPVWDYKLKSLFTTLIKIAYPDKSAPVLQDDTNNSLKEKNDIAETLALGYILYNDPEMGYFASHNVDRRVYWFVDDKQIQKLKSPNIEIPKVLSFEFPETKYYVMRQGWESNDKMMIITNGVDPYKPDHQHGDVLGIQAMAYGNVILPNYQVSYSEPDYDFFKNSLVKNVALVDHQLQGVNWTGNKGGTGFGKFKTLPKPTTIAWQTTTDHDFFAGSHDGFNSLGVDYSRQVIYIKDSFWIVKDNFSSKKKHVYSQVWQGNYTGQPDSLQSVFENGAGLNIIQLNPTDASINQESRQKKRTMVTKMNQNEYDFITLLYPFEKLENSIQIIKTGTHIGSWILNQLNFVAKGNQLTSISNENKHYLFNVKQFSISKFSIEFEKESDILINLKDNQIRIENIGILPLKHNSNMNSNNIILQPAETSTFYLNSE